jgi:NADH-quinone oxidoreductase subunit N
MKAAVFPFHAWAPDAYASTRLQVTAMLASVLKAAVVLALVRILGPAVLDGATGAMIGVLAIASIFYGNIAALSQPRFKRLLAYSSIAHAGYMVFALMDSTGNRASDLLWYTAFYAGGTLLASAAWAVLCPDGNDELSALDGKFSAHPVAALLLSMAVLSLAGMPPFPGFFAKLFVFKSVVASGHLVAAIVAFVGSFLGLAYYLGIVMRLFRTDARHSAATTN